MHPQIDDESRLVLAHSLKVSSNEAFATPSSQSAHVAPTPSDDSTKGTGVSKKDGCTGAPSAQRVHLLPMLASSGTSSAVTRRGVKLRKMTADQRMKRRPNITGVIGVDLSFILNGDMSQEMLGGFSTWICSFISLYDLLMHDVFIIMPSHRASFSFYSSSIVRQSCIINVLTNVLSQKLKKRSSIAAAVEESKSGPKPCMCVLLGVGIPIPLPRAQLDSPMCCLIF